MTVTTFRQKVFLILSGITLTLIIIEILLRLGGWAFSIRQDILNRGSKFSEGEYRILCLGESTTALGGENSYPFQLREILQQRDPTKKYVVINKGLVSKTTADILAQLPENLKRYRPHLMITMMGINDAGVFAERSWFARKVLPYLRRVRVYHLFELIREHWAHKFGPQKSLPPPPAGVAETSDVENMLAQESGLQQILKIMRDVHESANYRVSLQEQGKGSPQNQQEILRLRMTEIWLLAAMGKYQRVRGHYQEAEKALQQALALYPNGGVMVELAISYEEQGQYEKALPLLQKAVKLAPEMIETWAELARCYDHLGRDQEVFPLLDEIFARAEDFSWYYFEFGSWLLDRGYPEKASKFFIKGLEYNPKDLGVLRLLAESYQRQGKQKEAEEYRRKAAELQQQTSMYLPETVQNYREIIEQARSKGIKVIVMQYPLRSLAPLQAFIPRSSDVIFVDQESNFKDVLKTEKYDAVFKDYFGGDFGHCTRYGNRLIAERLADVILTQVVGD